MGSKITLMYKNTKRISIVGTVMPGTIEMFRIGVILLTTLGDLALIALLF